jgi:hypothetical protein
MRIAEQEAEMLYDSGKDATVVKLFDMDDQIRRLGEELTLARREAIRKYM